MKNSKQIEDFGKFVLLSLSVTAVVFVCYWPAMHGDFIWDDYILIVDSSHMIDLDGLKAIWFQGEGFNHPLTSSVFWLARQIWGLNPFPFHVLSVLFHGINAILFLNILRNLKIPGSIFAALVFALHPVQVESVAWISELKNVQSCFFYLIAILSYLKSQNQFDKKRLIWFNIALLSFALSLLSKTASIMLPLVLFLLSWWQGIKWRSVLFGLIPFFLLSFFAAVWTIWDQLFHAGATGLDWSLSWAEKLAIAGKIIWFYLSKLVWPHPLILIYERWSLQPTHFMFYFGMISFLLVTLTLFFLRKTKSGKHFFATWIYFILSLFPVLGFFNIYSMRYSFVADHFQYFATFSPIALLAAIVWNKRKWLLIRTVFSCLILALLATLTWQRSVVYSNEATLWEETVKQNPSSWLAQDSLGNVFAQHGNWSEAISHYREAIRLNPNMAGPFMNLAVALSNQGRFKEAYRNFKTSLQIDPNNIETYRNFANLLYKMNRVERAH